MQVKRFEIDGPLLFTPARHGDARGFFSEVFRQDLFEAEVGSVVFVQDNHSFSAPKGTLRGLHFQAPPAAQGKLVRVTRGAVMDVAVDIRRASPTFGRHVAVELSAENWAQLWVPPGFLHGFCTLMDDTEFLYKVTARYSPEHDGAVSWNDPDIAIEWPFPEAALTLSSKDLKAPRLADLPAIF
jgi:dTDP-4-dehydrorhamnose 3,5-epimerase